MTVSESEKDFFVSYTGVDKSWAEWIAWQLEAADYTCAIQAWDFGPGGNFVIKMDDAIKSSARLIAVLSPKYLESMYTLPEWAAFFAKDPTGRDGKVIPVRIAKVEIDGLLLPIVYADLVDKSEDDARDALLKAVSTKRGKPATAPSYPGAGPRSSTPSTPSTPAPAFPPTLPPRAFMVPHARNDNFTGREDILTTLRTALTSGATAALTQAIRGLGGIGKTQTAIEYAYRHEHDYTHVLWINADTRESATASMGEIARALGLPEADAQDRSVTVDAVKQWLAESSGYLVILDNADDLKIVPELLPTRRQGHVIITTRAVAMHGVARPIEIPKLDPDDGAAFLLRRANVDATDDKLAAAREVSVEMDGLPLALDQAGAYIEETGMSTHGYLDLYRQNRGRLLARAGQLSATDHASVAVTYGLALEKVEALDPAAAELVRFCAFLAPEPIPMSILAEGAKHLGDVLGLAMADDLTRNDTIAAAHRWSLLDRDGDSVSLHRVVQDVVGESMSAEDGHTWSERAVKAVNAAFPLIEFSNWPICEALLPHALVCGRYIAKDNTLSSTVAARLLNQTGYYLKQRADLAGAEPFYRRALAIREKALGPEHPDTATSLNNLAGLLHAEGDFAAADPLYRRALVIRETVQGPEHPLTAASLNNLAAILRDQGDYAGADPLYRRALAIDEKAHGPVHPDTATDLNNLARLLQDQGDYASADPLHRRALAIREKALGPEHPDIAVSLDNLAGLLRTQGDFVAADPLYRRALAIREKALGPDHPWTATTLNNLALLLHNQGNYAGAKPLYSRALAIKEKALGPDHPDSAASLNNLALLLQDQGDYTAADPLYRRALAVKEKTLGEEHPSTALTLDNLAGLLRKTGRVDEAVGYEERAAASRAAHAARNRRGDSSEL